MILGEVFCEASKIMFFFFIFDDHYSILGCNEVRDVIPRKSSFQQEDDDVEKGDEVISSGEGFLAMGVYAGETGASIERSKFFFFNMFSMFISISPSLTKIYQRNLLITFFNDLFRSSSFFH